MNCFKKSIVVALSIITFSLSLDGVTIAADNGVISFSAAAYTIAEGTSTVTITARRTGSSTGAVGVTYATSNGTIAGSDYTAKIGTLSWASGNTANKTFTVSITNDTLDESNETFNVTLSNPTGGAILGTPSSATVTITDNDNPPTVQFSAASSSGSEATTPATMTVVLSAASGKTVTVNYATANGTATAGSDYVATSGILTFNPGVTSQTINVPIINDLNNEASETFKVTLTNPVNATLRLRVTHTRTITDDDVRPTVQFQSASSRGSESTSPAAIVVTLSAASYQTVKVNYATANGTATAGRDYTATSGTLTFNPGVINQTINVPIINDTLIENNELFTLRLTNPSKATLGGKTTHTYTILDNYQLTVIKNGTGNGDVVSDIGSLSWSDNQGTGTYTSGDIVILTAKAALHSSFTSWTGCTIVNGNVCTVTMNAAKSVTATFTISSPFSLTWKIVDLGVLPGNDYSAAYDINDSGEIVGESGIVYGSQNGFCWRSGTLEPALGYGGDIARSINNQGVVGGVYSFLGGNNGFIRQNNGTSTFLTPPQNWSQSALYGINNIGHAVGTGYRYSQPNGHRGFIFDGTAILPIEPLAGDSETWAIAINDSDIVTGYSTSNPNQAVGRGFIFNSGNITEIGFLPGATCSYPEAINNQGVVVGSSGGQAFSYSNGVIKALGFLPGDEYSLAYGINDNGDIVGRSGDRAFIFWGGIMFDLSALPAVQEAGWTALYEARAINNSGQIVGQGLHNGSFHAFLLIPIFL